MSKILTCRFSYALSVSEIFLPLLSKNAINHPDKKWQNFTKLETTSPCDNVLLEHRLALELKERDLISNIYPVMIGQASVVSGVTVYGHFFSDGSAPSFEVNEIYVKSVESALVGHLEHLGLGTPLSADLSVSTTFKQLLKYQGFFFEGNIDEVSVKLVQRIMGMREEISSRQPFPEAMIGVESSAVAD